MPHPGTGFPSPGDNPFGRLAGTSVPQHPGFCHPCPIEVGRDFPFPQSRAIASRSLNAIIYAACLV